MAEIRCSVCGMLTPPSNIRALGEFVTSPEPGQCALASGTEKHAVCPTCTSRLAAEIAEGRTALLHPYESPDDCAADDAVADAPIQPFADGLLPAVIVPPSEDDKLDVHGAHAELPPGSHAGDSRVARDGSSVEFDFARKRHFAGYELLGEISRGSFGVVYKARQPGLDRIVALKVLLDGVHASKEAVERFYREAKSVARLKHPNVVPIYDIGASDGHHYFAMEFIEGYPLSTHILARTLTISDALGLAERIADALECAHKAGVIHRDIKPSNILVDKHGVPHITDFGLAKQIDLANKYTVSGTTLGTPAYMPPEQARGQIDKIDARSDVYALGTVLYEMLTGVTPFSGRSLLEVVVAVINEPVPPPRQLNPKIHRDIQTIVLKCLEKERGLRYASAAELRDDLRRFRSGEAILARPAGIFSRMARSFKRQKWFLASGAAGFMALLIAGKLIADSRTKDATIQKERESIAQEKKELEKKQQVQWIREWEFRGSSGLEPGHAAVYAPVPGGKLPAAETLVSPDTETLWGDYRAKLEFTLTPDAAAQGFTGGIQSITGIDGIPYVVEVRNGTARLWGPSDLYVFANNLRKRPDAPLALEIKLEKEAPALAAGVYKFTVERIGTRIKFTISGEPPPPPLSVQILNTPFPPLNETPAPPPLFPRTKSPQLAYSALPAPRPKGWGPVTLEIQDYNLSHWALKYTQLVLRKPPAGLLVQTGEVQRRFGGPPGMEVTALNNFNTGDYTGASFDFKVIAQSGDEFNQARAKYQLGLIKEICLSTGGSLDQIIGLYRDAKQTLSHLHASKTPPPAREYNELMQAIRMRLAVCYAKKTDWGSALDRWHAVDEELTQGWMSNTRVGEVLGWELQTVLDLAQREPDKDAVIGPQLSVFARCGLDPASSRIAESAKALGLLMSMKGRFAELRELYNAVPTPLLYDVFADAAGRALPLQPDEAFKLLTYLPLQPYKPSGENGAPSVPNVATSDAKKPASLAARAPDAVASLTRLHRLQDAATLLQRYPTTTAFRRFFDELQADAVTAEGAAAFYTDVLPKILAAMPKDEAVRVSLDRAMDRVGRTLAAEGRFGELPVLHFAIRGNLKFDARLATYFADGVDKLSAADDPESEELALKLLKYAGQHVARSQASLRQAASNMAKRKAANGDDGSFKTLLRIKECYPAAQIAPQIRQAMREYCQARRYDDAVAYFIQARGKFANEGAALLPDIIAALENTEAAKRDGQLDAVWKTVRDELTQHDDQTSLLSWRLEFGDLQLALANWNDAGTFYKGLLTDAASEPAIAARAAIRLMAINQARPDTAGDDKIAQTMALPGVPPEIQLAAQALGPNSTLRAKELQARYKAIQNPTMTEAEFTLFYGLRARLDNDEPAAQQFFKQALEKAQNGRLWTAAIASDFLRPKKVAIEKETIPAPPKPEAEAGQ